jgi:uncharacterized phage protein gp47/JayE
MTNLTLPKIDYASNDFSTFLDNLLNFLETELPSSDFNEFVASQLTMFMLRMNAYVSGVQSYKLDIIANEIFLPTAKQRRSILRFAKAVGYKVSAATASSVTVVASIPTPNPSPITIREGTTFTADNVIFEVDQDYILPAGSLTVNVGASQGQSYTQDFLSDGQPNQIFELLQFPVIQNSLTVFVDDIQWTEFDFIVFAAATDKAYVLSFDENNKGTVTTGDGTFGSIPPNGVTVRVNFRVGGGSEGNITAGAINTSIPAFINDITLTSISITNPQAASGGSDAESIDHAKLFIPKHLKTIDHAVTDDDYDTLSAGFSDPTVGTVAKANATLRGGELNKIDIFVWTRLPDETLTGASLALRNALKGYIQERNVISHDIAVFSGVTQSVNIEANVIYQAARTEAEMTTSLDSTVADFFKSVDLNPGDDIFLSQLYALIQAVPGVKSLIMVTPTTDVAVPSSQIAVLGTTTWNLAAAELGT